MASPRGSAFGLLSAISGIPVELEKRTETGVFSRIKCGARERDLASGTGVKTPVSIVPLAWAGRKPGLRPKIWSNCWSRSLARARSFSSLGSGMVTHLLKLFLGTGRLHADLNKAG